MGSHITIFCHSATRITLQDIAKFIHDGFFFEDPSIFDPPVDKEPFVERTSLVIYYQPDKRPVEIAYYRNVNTSETKQEITAAILIEEAVQEIKAQNSDRNCIDVIEKVRSSSQVFVISFDDWGLTEDVWEMLSCVEAFLAETLEGIIYATEGFYDKQLQSVLKLQPK